MDLLKPSIISYSLEITKELELLNYNDYTFLSKIYLFLLERKMYRGEEAEKNIFRLIHSPSDCKYYWVIFHGIEIPYLIIYRLKDILLPLLYE